MPSVSTTAPARANSTRVAISSTGLSTPSMATTPSTNIRFCPQTPDKAAAKIYSSVVGCFVPRHGRRRGRDASATLSMTFLLLPAPCSLLPENGYSWR